MNMTTFSKIAHWYLDLIFPKFCLGCGQEGSHLCLGCFDTLPITKSTACFICGKRSPSGQACQNCRRKHHSFLSGILIASDWNNLLLRQIIYGYKYQFIKELAASLSQLMINFLQTNKPTNWSTDELILIPVPLHGRRLAWRGFNQAEILTKKISGYFNTELNQSLLIRRRYTLPQKEISNQKERVVNIKSAFALSPKLNLPNNTNNNLIKNKIIILVDDVCTTGSTLEDCARALSPLKPKEIWGLVIARG
ncbi:MAG: Phosphoribosyltransferase [Parcubacteria group bacterium GW2011_GWA2_43_9b]|nr:MAG: Phosphoribosyltransferase [Parcubacteria group bacterium GW2011_GWA2_43_9b]